MNGLANEKASVVHSVRCVCLSTPALNFAFAVDSLKSLLKERRTSYMQLCRAFGVCIDRCHWNVVHRRTADEYLRTYCSVCRDEYYFPAPSVPHSRGWCYPAYHRSVGLSSFSPSTERPAAVSMALLNGSHAACCSKGHEVDGCRKRGRLFLFFFFARRTMMRSIPPILRPAPLDFFLSFLWGRRVSRCCRPECRSGTRSRQGSSQRSGSSWMRYVAWVITRNSLKASREGFQASKLPSFQASNGVSSVELIRNQNQCRVCGKHEPV